MVVGSSGEVGLVMELMPGGSLYAAVRKVDEDTLRVSSVATAVSHGNRCRVCVKSSTRWNSLYSLMLHASVNCAMRRLALPTQQLSMSLG
jgi:hypothetical protein